MNAAKRIALPALLVALAAAARAITPDEAKNLFEAGDFETAAPVLAEAAAAEPKNATLNQMAGIALFNSGNRRDARRFLKAGRNEANLYLAQIEMFDYNFDAAENYLDRYEDGFRKNRRAPKVEREEATELRERIEAGRAMMDRVERVVIIDSLDVDRESFFRAYRLAPSSGSLVAPEFLPRGFEASDPTVVYVTERGDNIYWSAPDEDQNLRIATTSLLADNSWEKPGLLSLDLNEGGEANYPFMLSDGVTLYFANTGENSLGGYDIFISRRDGNEFLQPQNIGMPYNSYANDYMMAIDEETGVGWWATDRNAAPDRLTIYLFKPSDLRINYPVDQPQLASLARIDRFRDTWEPGADYSALLDAIKEIAPRQENSNAPTICLSVPGRGIYTSLSDFRSAEARSLASEYIRLKSEADTARRRLEAMRRNYAAGNTGLASEILDAEQSLERLKQRLLEASNAVIEAETL